jgi:hypothetical protein
MTDVLGPTPLNALRSTFQCPIQLPIVSVMRFSLREELGDAASENKNEQKTKGNEMTDPFQVNASHTFSNKTPCAAHEEKEQNRHRKGTQASVCSAV